MTDTVGKAFNPVRRQKQSSRGVLENFAKLIGKQLCQSLLFNIVAGFRSATLFKRRPCPRCFPMDFVTFKNTSFHRIPPVAASEAT